jgi:TetR/AcrR family transcriptional regulator, cholesterol catabolism regulator
VGKQKNLPDFRRVAKKLIFAHSKSKKYMKSRKEQIKAVSAQLFRKKGFRATSMQDIAEAMDIKAASLYNHIKSKQEILCELSLNMAHLFTNGMNDIRRSSLTSIDKIKKIIGLHVHLTIEHTDAIALITSEWVHLEKEFVEQFNTKPYYSYLELREKYEADFKKILQDCIDDGYFEPINIEIAMFSTLSSLHWLYSWYSKNKANISPIELESQMIKCLVDGLRKR